jgi:hypothetical protein
MTSPAKVAANRRNAQKSTGPRTDAGKAKSSMNALTHGLRALCPVVPGEDQEAYWQFHDSMFADLAPVGIQEEELAQLVTDIYWRLRRSTRFETGAITRNTEKALQRLRSQDVGLTPAEQGVAEPIDIPINKPTVASLRSNLERWLPLADKSIITARLFKKLSDASAKTKFGGKDAMRLLRQHKEYSLPEDYRDPGDFLPPIDKKAPSDYSRNRDRSNRSFKEMMAREGNLVEFTRPDPDDPPEIQKEIADHNARLEQSLIQRGFKFTHVPYSQSASPRKRVSDQNTNAKQTDQPSGGATAQSAENAPAADGKPPPPIGWPGKYPNIPPEDWTPAYDSMSDPDFPEFLQLIGVPPEHLATPEKWTGWTAKVILRGVKQIATVMGLEEADLLARGVQKSASDRDAWHTKVVEARRELEELERIQANQVEEAYEEAMMLGSKRTEMIMKNEVHLQRQLTRYLKLLNDLQAKRAGMPSPPRLILEVPGMD